MLRTRRVPFMNALSVPLSSVRPSKNLRGCFRGAAETPLEAKNAETHATSNGVRKNPAVFERRLTQTPTAIRPVPSIALGNPLVDFPRLNATQRKPVPGKQPTRVPERSNSHVVFGSRARSDAVQATVRPA